MPPPERAVLRSGPRRMLNGAHRSNNTTMTSLLEIVCPKAQITLWLNSLVDGEDREVDAERNIKIHQNGLSDT